MSIFDITVVGGIGVLSGYLNLGLTDLLDGLKKKYSKLEWKFWSISAVLTIISFLAIIIWYSFFAKLNDQTDLFISSLITFLVGAIIWSNSIIFQYFKNKKKKTSQELIALTLTTIGAFGMLLAIIYNTDNWLLITAGVIVFFHHLFFDNYYWYFVQN